MQTDTMQHGITRRSVAQGRTAQGGSPRREVVRRDTMQLRYNLSLSLCIRVCVYIYIYICVCVCISLSLYIYVYKYVCVYIYIYIYSHIYDVSAPRPALPDAGIAVMDRTDMRAPQLGTGEKLCDLKRQVER